MSLSPLVDQFATDVKTAARGGDRFVSKIGHDRLPSRQPFSRRRELVHQRLKDITWRGEKYLWRQIARVIRFVAAPKKSGEIFELATNIKDRQTREKLSVTVAF